MSTEVGFFLLSSEPRAEIALEEARLELLEMERTLSRFRPESELCQLNLKAGLGAQKVSKLLFDVVAFALHLASQTQGLVDPTILPALVTAGYGPGLESGEIGYKSVHLNENSQTIELELETTLDLGGIAKGWMADRLAARLSSYGPALVDLGGDIRAMGDYSWSVGVENPWQRSRDLEEWQFSNCGVATSSVLKRSWANGHHLIDPRSGKPAITDLAAVSVIAPCAGQAEAAAKAALLLGEKQALELLQQGPYRALLMKKNRAIKRVNI